MKKTTEDWLISAESDLITPSPLTIHHSPLTTHHLIRVNPLIK